MRNKEKQKEYMKQYYLQNKEKIKKQVKQYQLQNKKKIVKRKKQFWLQNKEKIKRYRLENKNVIKEWSRQYHFQNKKRINKRIIKYTFNRRKTDINFRVVDNLRKRLRSALKYNYKSGSAVLDLGCTIEYFKKWIENQFRNGMSWENYGKWEIDHQIPLSIVDLTDRDNLLQVCHYTNLQPMWKDENRKKGNSVGRINKQ